MQGLKGQDGDGSGDEAGDAAGDAVFGVLVRRTGSACSGFRDGCNSDRERSLHEQADWSQRLM